MIDARLRALAQCVGEHAVEVGTDRLRHRLAHLAVAGRISLRIGFDDFCRDRNDEFVAGVTMRRTPLVMRGGSAEGMPTQLEQVLFGLKPGEPAMVESAEAFIVAVPAEIIEPDAKTDPVGYSQVRDAVARTLANDLATVFAEALRQRAQPQINQPVLDSVTGGQ